MSNVWFVTGASKGFGREFVLAALERGDKVAATARNTDTLSDLVRQCGDAVLPVELDVTDRDQVFAAVRSAHETFGRIDVVINNAGDRSNELSLVGVRRTRSPHPAAS
jgi:NADP-dependent 3-hydroxy acid dehydrogenase YdfG